MMYSRSVLVLLVLLVPAESARILGMFPLFAKSHHTIIQPIMKALARAGHDVVVYSPFPLEEPHPNYTDVHLDNILSSVGDLTEFIQAIANFPHWKCLDCIFPVPGRLMPGFFANKKVQALIKSDEKFDLVMIEAYCGQEFTFIFGHIFKAPVIGVQTFFLNTIININIGNTLSPVTVPDNCTPHTDKMSFSERLLNAFSVLRTQYQYFNDYLPMVEGKLRQYIPEGPPLLELSNNLSLIIVNDHAMADYARPRTPNIVPVAGIHIEPEKPLPKDLQKYMDDAPEGVILFSLGSLFPDDLQPKEHFDMYINVFKKFPQRVIWKTRKDNIEGLPSNVKTVKWMPQRDILAHPNCVLFITHGGIASQHETIHNGVPVIGIPHFADQHRNVAFYHAKEVGVRVFPKDISEESMTAAIREVIGNPKYRENMKRLSRIFRDRPLSPAETVVFWTDYVLRHGGAGHLRPASTQLRWYQLALLDVLAVFLAVTVAFIVGLYHIVKRILYTIRCRLLTVTKSVKKNK